MIRFKVVLLGGARNDTFCEQGVNKCGRRVREGCIGQGRDARANGGLNLMGFWDLFFSN